MIQIATSVRSLSAALLLLAAGPAAAAQLITGDVAVQDALCVGADCTAGENFGFDTIRLKGAALRIHFQDTSLPVYGYPSTDWRLLLNANDKGGPNYFRLEEVDSGLSPLTIEAGARMHALYVADTGVGLGTGAPLTDLHVAGGDSPALRLHQDGTGGFQPYAWDLGGNEVGFFVRDVTGGGTLPLRVRAGAPANSVHVAANGNVGFGTDTPLWSLHVRETGAGNDAVLGLEANGVVWEITSNAATGRVTWGPTGGNDVFKMDSGGVENLFRVGVLDDHIVDVNGDLVLNGALTENSDRASKTAIVPVDPGAILDRLTRLEISAWSYRRDAAAGIRHIGPMAQDFYALFGLGAGETGISTLDTSGVALAAIQALAAENALLRTETAALRARIAALEAR